MFLGITVIGWVLIVLVYVPLAGAVMWLLAKWLRPVGRAKWPVLAGVGLALAALPVADSVWLDWKFKQLCKGSGISISQTVSVDGFFDGEVAWSEAGLEESGYRFVEFEDRRPNLREDIVRLEVENGHVRKSRLEKPSARYHTRLLKLHQPVEYRITVVESEVVDTQSGKVIATQRIYSRYVGWVDQLWRRYFDQVPYQQCPPPEDSPNLRAQVLIPSAKH